MIGVIDYGAGNLGSVMNALKRLGCEGRFVKDPEEIAGGKAPYEKILFIHFLCEGKYFPSQGRRLAYNEVPWGGVYYRNFEGRCLKRCAFTFGKDIQGFKKMIEQNPQLKAELLPTGDAGYRFEFINGLFISLMLWGADDEFPLGADPL